MIKLRELLAKSPTVESSDAESLRLAIVAEYDAISLYEQLAQKVNNEKIKSVLLDIAKEEKTHVGELQALLLQVDSEQASELKKGAEEVEKV